MKNKYFILSISSFLFAASSFAGVLRERDFHKSISLTVQGDQFTIQTEMVDSLPGTYPLSVLTEFMQNGLYKPEIDSLAPMTTALLSGGECGDGPNAVSFIEAPIGIAFDAALLPLTSGIFLNEKRQHDLDSRTFEKLTSSDAVVVVGTKRFARMSSHIQNLLEWAKKSN